MDGLFIKVKLSDGYENTFSLRPKTIVAFEQKFGGGFGKLLGNDQKIEHIYWLAWKSCVENSVVVKPFDSGFLDSLENAELVTDPNSESTENL
jgi:hypothetical protein